MLPQCSLLVCDGNICSVCPAAHAESNPLFHIQSHAYGKADPFQFMFILAFSLISLVSRVGSHPNQATISFLHTHCQWLTEKNTRCSSSKPAKTPTVTHTKKTMTVMMTLRASSCSPTWSSAARPGSMSSSRRRPS